MLQLTGCGGTYKSNTKKDCTSITLQDTEFQMPSMFLKDAEDVNELNDTISFSKTYVCSTENEYCCVNMESFIVYLFFGTSEASSLNDYIELFYEKGLRLEMNEDNAVLGEDACGNQKTIIEKAYCEAVLTDELYEDYTGKVALIREADRNICLYVGAKGRYTELTSDVEKVLDDVAYTLTSVKQDMVEESSMIQEATEIELGKAAVVSVLTDNGSVKDIELQSITLVNDTTYQSELKDAPADYRWEFVRITGPEELEQLNIKVKDLNGETFAYGSRTYTVFCANGERIDAYLVPQAETEYMLELGEMGKPSILKIS